MEPTWGVVLNGGQSSRFGRDKARAQFDGRSLIAHVVDRLGPQVANLAVAGNATAHCPTTLHDGDYGGRGPLAGLLAGLEWASAGNTTYLAACACDLPQLPTNLVEVLLAAATPTRPVVLRHSDRLQLSAALWPVAATSHVKDILAENDRFSLHNAFNQLDGIVLDASAHDLDGSFANINTMDDLARLGESSQKW